MKRNKLIIFLLLLYSCQDKMNYYSLNKNLDYPVYHHQSLRSEKYNLENGLSYFITLEYQNNSNKNDTSFNMIFAYKSGDTLNLIIEDFTRNTLIRILGNKYSSETTYLSDIGEFPEGNKNGAFFKTEYKSHQLIFKNASFEVGDTLFGYIDFETKSFLYHDPINDRVIQRIDHLSGPFVTKIQTKESFENNMFNKPMDKSMR